MNPPKPMSRLTRLRWLDEIPDAVAAPALAISIVQICSALAPLGALRRVWRMVELSPGRIVRAIEAGDVLGVVRPYLGYIFFHINFTHYLLNLAAICGLGVFVHREMSARANPGRSDASAAFLAFFLLSGLAAGFAYCAANLQAYRGMLGASGAAAGLFGAAIWITITRHGETENWRKGAALTLATLNVVMLTYLIDTSPLSRFLFNSASAWQAHAGGYVFGLFAYPLFERMAQSSR